LSATEHPHYLKQYSPEGPVVHRIASLSDVSAYTRPSLDALRPSMEIACAELLNRIDN
jgi:hypothetical protein